MIAAKRDAGMYLQDILAAIDRISEYTTEGHEVFRVKPMVQDAVIRQLSIIGEAAAKLPLALKTTQPPIPWKNIVAMRNILIHDYSETDLPTIWDAVESDLPPLRTAVEKMRQDRRT